MSNIFRIQHFTIFLFVLFDKIKAWHLYCFLYLFPCKLHFVVFKVKFLAFSKGLKSFFNKEGQSLEICPSQALMIVNCLIILTTCVKWLKELWIEITPVLVWQFIAFTFMFWVVNQTERWKYRNKFDQILIQLSWSPKSWVLDARQYSWDKLLLQTSLWPNLWILLSHCEIGIAPKTALHGWIILLYHFQNVWNDVINVILRHFRWNILDKFAYKLKASRAYARSATLCQKFPKSSLWCLILFFFICLVFFRFFVINNFKSKIRDHFCVELIYRLLIWIILNPSLGEFETLSQSLQDLTDNSIIYFFFLSLVKVKLIFGELLLSLFEVFVSEIKKMPIWLFEHSISHFLGEGLVKWLSTESAYLGRIIKKWAKPGSEYLVHMLG